MPDPSGDFATVWFLLRRVHTLMDRAGEALFRSGLGISFAQFLVLSVVDAHPGEINQQAVADRLGLTRSTVSRQIENAVSAGLMTVSVSPHSRRENLVALTPEGTAIVRRGDELTDRSTGAFLPGLDPADLAATARTLAALNEAMGGGTLP